VVINDGTAKDGKQAVAMCQSMFDRHDQEMSTIDFSGDDNMQLYLDASAERTHNQYKKDAIRVGNYVHPITGQKVDVPASRLSHWVQQFKRMSANGINIPIRDGHRGKALGWIDDMMEDGTQLDAVHNFPDEDGVKTARRYRGVSIGVKPVYKDCFGNIYKDVIDHIALTPEPVITGQGDFIALSRENEGNQPEAAGDGTDATNEEMSMEWLNEALSLPADATEDQLKQAVEALKAPKAEEKPADEPKAEMSMELALSRRETAVVRLDRMQELGKITPAARKLIEENFMGTAEAPNTVCLAREDDAPSTVDSVIKVIEENSVAVKTGEKTGAQLPEGTAELAREDEEDPKLKLAREEQEASDKLKADMLLSLSEDQRTDAANEWLEEYKQKQSDKE
jgi:hypothetical protein